jgi:hypothetical protein
LGAVAWNVSVGGVTERFGEATFAVTMTYQGEQLAQETVRVPVCCPTERDVASTLTLRGCGVLEAVPLAGFTMIHGSAAVVNGSGPPLLATVSVSGVEILPAIAGKTSALALTVKAPGVTENITLTIAGD